MYAHYDEIQHGQEAHRAYAITGDGLKEYHAPGHVMVHSAFDISHIPLNTEDTSYQIMLAARRENLNPVAIGLLLGTKNPQGALSNARTLYPFKRYLERQGFDAIKMTDPKDAGREVYIVFNTSQIKPGQHKGTTRYSRVDQLMRQRNLTDRITRYAAKHAPTGGVTIQGRKFSGGEFIPAGEYDKATPQEKAVIDSKTPPPAKKTGDYQLPPWYTAHVDNERKRDAASVDMKNQAAIAGRIKNAAAQFLIRNPGMEQKAADFTKLMSHIASRFSPKATAIISKNLQEIRLMPTVKAVTTDLEGREHRRHKPGDSTAGYYNPAGGLLVVDGDADWGRSIDPTLKDPNAMAGRQQGLAHNVYAHELWHAVDSDREGQRDMVYSGTQEWIDAGNKEIVKWDYEKDSHGDNMPVRPLTDYATTRPDEGFAEYGRLVINDPATAQKKFPLCWAFFKNNGLV